VRFGLVLLDQSDWAPDARARAYYEPRLGPRSQIELHLDLAAAEDSDPVPDVLYLRAYAGAGGRPAPWRASRFHPVYGAGLAYEVAELRAGGGRVERYALLGRLGLAAGPRSGRWDVRLVYSVLVGRGDVSDEVLAAFDVGF
jgi:hypothetical protein